MKNENGLVNARWKKRRLVYGIIVALLFFLLLSCFVQSAIQESQSEEKKTGDEKNWTNLRVSMLKTSAKCKLCRQCAHTPSLENPWQSDQVTDFEWIEHAKQIRKQKGFQGDERRLLHVQHGSRLVKRTPKKVLNVGKIREQEKNGCHISMVCPAPHRLIRVFLSSLSLTSLFSIQTVGLQNRFINTRDFFFSNRFFFSSVSRSLLFS